MTRGTIHSIKCPRCLCSFSPRACGINDPLYGGIDEREVVCPTCQKSVYLWVRWSVTVEAEKTEKVR